MRLRSWWPLGLVGLAVLLSAGFFMPQERDDDLYAIRKNFEIFGTLYEELVAGYVDPLDAERVMRRGIAAMLEDLDPYTVFFDEAQNTDMRVVTQGGFGGVGFDIDVRGDQLTVTGPSGGASGFQQGIRVGDTITHINGRAVAGLTLSDAITLIRGEPGTTVEVRIEREGQTEPLTFILTREAEQRRSVSYSGFVRDDTTAGLGYIKLDVFAVGSASEVQAALQSLQDTGQLQGLVLDLRDNPGGLLRDAIAISQLFVPQGSVIVSTRGRLSSSETVFRSSEAPIAPDLPVVVLMSSISASASEIVAGALQDHDRAVILGEASFGKGLVQNVRPLPYNTALKITTARYYIPSGRSIQAIDYRRHDGDFSAIPDSLRRTFQTLGGRTVKDGRGIEPDVDLTPEPPSDLEQALDRRAAFFFFANHYAAQYPERTPPSEDTCFDLAACSQIASPFTDTGFAVTDAIYDAFQAWLADEDFTYKTSVERATERLAADLADLGYTASGELAALNDAINAGKAADFTRYADRIKARLQAELLARHLSPGAATKAALRDDPYLGEAVRYLGDGKAYGRILGR